MHELKKFETMSSLEIAELTGKQHRHVTRDIKSILEEAEIDMSRFGHKYLDAYNREQPCYRLPYQETMLIMSGYSVKVRLAIIKRWMELEQQAKAWKDVRFLTKDSYKRMADTLTEHRARLGKATKRFHYANEARMISRICGLPDKNTRDELDKDVLNKLDAITDMDRVLIMHDVEYRRRKELLLETCVSNRLVDKKMEEA